MEHIIDGMPFNWVLLLTIVGEFLLPCILKYFYKGKRGIVGACTLLCMYIPFLYHSTDKILG